MHSEALTFIRSHFPFFIERVCLVPAATNNSSAIYELLAAVFSKHVIMPVV